MKNDIRAWLLWWTPRIVHEYIRRRYGWHIVNAHRPGAWRPDIIPYRVFFTRWY